MNEMRGGSRRYRQALIVRAIAGGAMESVEEKRE
jgi:hypothetical protein